MSSFSSKRFWIFGGGVAGMVLLLMAIIAVNLLLGSLRWRADLTEDRLFSLSEGTQKILRELDAPVTIKFFFSKSTPEVPIPLKQFAQEVADLLKEYQIAAGGKLILETYDPQPDSDAEEWAERYGLAGQNLGMLGAGGSTLYLGLVAVKGDVHFAIPFIDPRTEGLLEYNISQLITRLANPNKPILGVMSSLPVMGIQNFPYAMPGQPPPQNLPPWIAFQNLGEDYDIRQIPMQATEIADDISTLVLVHPKQMSEQTQFAVDQFVLRGGRLLAFVDPFCLADAAQQDPNAMMMGMRPQTSSDLGKLLEAWGIDYEVGNVVADMQASTRVRMGPTGVDDSLVFLSLTKANINADDTITANLESMVLPCAGAFSGSGKEGITVSPLLTSSKQSQTVGAMLAQIGGDALRRQFQPGQKNLNLAIRLDGKFQTAFPDGKPAKPPDADDQKEDETPEPEGDDQTPALKESAAATSIILVADVDLLFNHFAAQELEFLGYRIYQPINDNLNFFFNALEQLSGNADLSRIRTRGRFSRPFDRVLALQREAQQHWYLQEKALQEKLESTQQRLETLQAQKDKTQRYILSPEQEQEIQNFKQEQLKTQRELKEVRKKLREGIERLGVTVKVINILLTPVLVILAGIMFSLYRRQKNKK